MIPILFFTNFSVCLKFFKKVGGGGKLTILSNVELELVRKYEKSRLFLN